MNLPNTPTQIITEGKVSLTERAKEVAEICEIADEKGYTMMYIYKEDSPSNSSQKNNKSIMMQCFSTKDATVIAAITGGAMTNLNEVDE